MRPVEILYEEFKTNLIALVNNSGLPPFIISQVLEFVLHEVRDLERTHYEQALKEDNQNNEG